MQAAYASTLSFHADDEPWRKMKEEEEQLHCSELASQRIVVSGFGPFQLPRAELIVEASSPIARILLVWRGPAFSRWRCLVEQGSAVRQSWTMAGLGRALQSQQGYYSESQLGLTHGLTGSLRKPYAESAQTFPSFAMCSSKGQYCFPRPNG